MQPVRRNQSFNRLFMPGRNKWPWVLAGSPWLTIRHVTPAEATNSSPDTEQEAWCELLPPPIPITYSQHTRLQAVLGTLHYNCIVWHACVFLTVHTQIYILNGSSWAMGCSSATLQECHINCPIIITSTIYSESQTSVSEHETSASTALVPLIKLMMCVWQISFYFAHKVPKAKQQLKTTAYLYDTPNRRSHHNTFTTFWFVPSCIWVELSYIMNIVTSEMVVGSAWLA